VALTNGNNTSASPGDKYKVKLRIAGRWRTVDWECVETSKSQAEPSDDGQYYIAASWASWGCDQELVKVGPGKYQADVALASSHSRFQVLRNKDWSQTFFPVGTSVMGPSSASYASSWAVEGDSGDVVRIVLQRSWQKGTWSQTVNMEKVGSKPLTDLADESRPRYFLVGAGSTVKYELESVSNLGYAITLQLTDGAVPFQVLYDGDFRRVFYPNVKCVSSNIPHRILGPAVDPGARNSWLIKRDLDDTSEDGGWYTVELTVSPLDRTPQAVRWKRTA